MDQQRIKNKFLWVREHVGITGNKNENTTAKEALKERIQSTEKYPPQDQSKLIEQKHQEEQQEK
jgi:hypothetical protein